MTSKDKIIYTMAEALDLEPAVLQAVVAVETGGEAFLPDGRPKILFEGHIFWKRLSDAGRNPQEIVAKEPKYTPILYPRWTTKPYKGGAKEYNRLALASEISLEIAQESASWGLFQIMGFNYSLCQKDSIGAFVAAQQDIEGQAECAAHFLENQKLIDKLRTHDWAGFAKVYNGKLYKLHAYDEKLEQAYRRYKK